MTITRFAVTEVELCSRVSIYFSAYMLLYAMLEPSANKAPHITKQPATSCCAPSLQPSNGQTEDVETRNTLVRESCRQVDTIQANWAFMEQPAFIDRYRTGPSQTAELTVLFTRGHGMQMEVGRRPRCYRTRDTYSLHSSSFSGSTSLMCRIL